MQNLLREKNLFALSLIIFIDNLSYYVVMPVLLRIIVHGSYHIVAPTMSLATRNLIYGTAIALSPAMGIIAAPFIGSLSDRIGRKRTLFICLFGSVFAFLLPVIGIFSHSLILIICGRALAGISDCSQAIAQAAIADATSGKQKAKYLGIILFSVSLALILGPFIGSFLSDPHLVTWFDISTPYWIGLALALFNFLLLLEFFKDMGFKSIKQFSFTDTIAFAARVFKNPDLARFILVFFCLQFGWAEYYINNYLYLTQVFHYSTDKLGLFATYVGVWIALGLLVAYPLVLKKMPLQKAFSYAIVVMTISMSMTLIPNSLIQWLCAIPLGLAGAIAYAGGVTLMSDYFPANRQGWCMGLISLIISLSWLLSGILPSILININYLLPPMLAFLLLLIGTLILSTKVNFGKLSPDGITESIKQV